MFLLFLGIGLSLLIVVPSVIFIQRTLRQRTQARSLQIHSAKGVVDERFVRIGGIEQWIDIRGEDRNNPILFIVHGGPGSSCVIFAPRTRAWEKHFTLVQWDQRGSGKTLGRTGKSRTGPLTFDRLTQDGIEIAEYLRQLFPACPLVLVGHSLGSTFALSMLKRRPELFSAYVGTDQNTGMVRSRDEMHRSTLARLRSAGLLKGVAALERIGSDPSAWSADDYLAIAQWTMKSDPAGARRIFTLLKQSVWYAPGHSLADIRNFASGMRLSLEQLLPDIVRFDAWSECRHFAMPFFIVQGEHDVLTPPALAEAYLNDITAPVKGMSLIRNAGHFAAFLEPDQFLQHLLQHVRPLIVATDAIPSLVALDRR